jgi:Fe-S cluster assembly protein SufD
MTEAPVTPYTDALARIAGPEWHADARRSALNRFLQAGLPDALQEDWKYTSLKHLAQQDLHTPGEPTRGVPAIEEYPGILVAYEDDRLAWHDTRLPPGVLNTLADIAPIAGFGEVAGSGALAQLNDALWRKGVSLRVTAGERLRLPVFLRFAAAETNAMLYPRVMAVVGAGAEAVLVEHYTGERGIPYWQNAVTEIVLEAGARLTHVRIQEEGDEATHTGITAVRQQRGSSYRALSLTLTGKVGRHDLRLALEGDGASARLDGVFIADERRHAEQHLHIVHAAPRTMSRTTYRGLASGRGRGVFDARVVVLRGAVKADAQQSSRNLLLSSQAEIDAKPQLEIHADDVKCGHAATVGRLDEGALFYLQSRGIARPVARRLLMEAFVDEALGLLQDTGLADWLRPRLVQRLPAADVQEIRP